MAVSLLVLHQTRSTGLAALAFATSLLPAFLGATFLSGIADRRSRRTILVLGDSARTVIIALLALPGDALWLELVLIGLVSVIDGPCTAARASLLRAVTGTSEGFQSVTAVDEALSQTGQVTGYLAGGSAVLILGVHNGILLDAVSFALSALMILAVVPKDRPGPPRSPSRTEPDLGTPHGPGRVRGLLGDAAVGWRAVTAPVCRALVLRTWLLTAATVAPEGVAVAWARELGTGPVQAGFLLAANPIGAVLGLVVLTIVKPSNTPALRAGSLWVALLPLMACAAKPSLPVACLLVAVSGVGMTYSTLARVVFAETVPDDQRARAFGFASSGLLVSQGAGILAVGSLADVTDVPTAVAAGAAFVALASLGLLERSGRVVPGAEPSLDDVRVTGR